MGAVRVIRQLRGLLDVDLTGAVNGDVLTYRSSDQKIVPAASVAGGSGAVTLIEDVVTGYPNRPVTTSAVLWIGWSDPTLLMHQYDIFIPVPNPA